LHSALVVEDSRTQAALLLGILRSNGWEATLAENGVEALALLETQRFDVVVSDVQMPVMGGYELCRSIKADSRHAGMPVVLLTSLNQPEDVLQGLECGADNFVTKPYEPDLLLKRVMRLLNRGELAEQREAGSMAARFTLFGKEVQLELRQGHVLDYLVSTFEDFVRTREREREAQEESSLLRESERFLQSTLDALSSAIAIVEGSGRIVAVNREWLAQTAGHPLVGPPLTVGAGWLAACTDAIGQATGVNALEEVTRDVLAGHSQRVLVESEHLPEGEASSCFRVRVSSLGDQGAPRAVLAFEDVTELKAVERQLEHDAYHDPLTGLPNRSLFNERLSQAFMRTRRGGRQFAVLFLDLDRFKVVNDSLGHQAGDRMLVSMGERIRGAIRDQDTAARLGGDEFAVLLDGLVDDRFVAFIAERIQKTICERLMLGDAEVFSSASIGVVLSSPAYSSPDQILRDADIAMYRAKGEGRGRFSVFDEAMHARAMEQLRIETELRHAIEEGELVLHYQPILDIRTREVVALEALVRWQHPERGLVPPGVFIEVAEDSGLINELGKWVVREACEQIARWQRASTFDPVTVNVNLSGHQLGGESLAAWIAGVIEETGIDGSYLAFEMTESALLDRGTEVADAILELKEVGGGLSMDDFGTGYSSLSALRQHPFDSLKIDRSFVGTMETDAQNLEIVRALISMAHGLGMTVVAEGVELPEHFDTLVELGCDRAQGWLFARALPANEVASMIGTVLELPSSLR